MRLKTIFLLMLVVLGVHSDKSFASYDLILDRFGVRALGMGGAFSAIAEGPEAIFYNWAPVVDVGEFSFKIESGSTLELPFYTVAAENLFNIPNLRGGGMWTSESGIPGTSLNLISHPEATGTSYSYSNSFWMLAWAYKYFGHDWGIRLSRHAQDAAGQDAQSTQLDVAVKKSYTLFGHNVDGALVLRNMYRISHLKWSTGLTEKIPRVLIGGINYRALDGRLNLAMDIELEGSQDLKYFSGFEYYLVGGFDYLNSFIARGGLRNGDLAVGLGVYMGDLLFDYALIMPKSVDGTDLFENEHRFSVGMRFGELIQNRDTRKKVNIPTIRLDKKLDEYGLSLSPLTDDFQKPKTPEEEEPDQYEGPAMLLLGKLIIESPTSVRFVIEDLHQKATSRMIHKGRNIVSKVTGTYSVPIQLIFTPIGPSQALTFEIEFNKSSGSLIIYSELSDEYQVLFDGRSLTASNGQIFKELTVIELNTKREIEVLLFLK